MQRLCGESGKPRALVTGASGFVGRVVCQELVAAGWEVIGQVFRHAAPQGALPLPVDLCQLMAPMSICPQVDAVIHLAGLAHVPADQVERGMVWQTNVAPTEALARAAAEWGAHFVYVSSAKVLGESGEWDDSAEPAPADLYAESKLAAEEAVNAIPGLAFTIVRPPLVYGPGVKGNFLRLLRWADAGWPLPLAALENQRSLIFVNNLASALVSCLSQPTVASGKTWLVSDSHPWGMASLIRQLATHLGRPARLFRVKQFTLLRIAHLCGMTAEAERLTGQFVVHDQQIRAELEWTPPHDSTAALKTTADWYRLTTTGGTA
jgi:nucleoside-diphosphate-sugar epimerase